MIRSILSILIPTLEDRRESFDKLVSELDRQIDQLYMGRNCIDIHYLRDNGEMSTGEKRNTLIRNCDGIYVVFCDDDDWVAPDYIEEIIRAAVQMPDCIAIDGLMTTNGLFPIPFYHTKDANYGARKDDQGNVIYEKWPTHITPIKRAIAIQILFPDFYFGEDYQWAKALHESGLIKTEVRIRKPLYYYLYRPIKPLPYGKY